MWGDFPAEEAPWTMARSSDEAQQIWKEGWGVKIPVCVHSRMKAAHESVTVNMF